MNGKTSSVRHGLKRWQGMVEMAHIYADSEDESTRGGGLLMPIELPVDSMMSACRFEGSERSV